MKRQHESFALDYSSQLQHNDNLKKLRVGEYEYPQQHHQQHPYQQHPYLSQQHLQQQQYQHQSHSMQSHLSSQTSSPLLQQQLSYAASPAMSQHNQPSHLVSILLVLFVLCTCSLFPTPV